MATASSVTAFSRAAVSQRLEDLTSMQTTIYPNVTVVTVGDTWEQCSKWYEAMPGAFFQLFNLLLCLTFMASGHTEIAASYTHLMSMVAFAGLALWGFLDACSVDIIVWGLAIAFINLFQLITTCRRSKMIRLIMGKDGMGRLHTTRFAPFNISPQLFVELVTCKGCEITHMDVGKVYAKEDITPSQRVALLLSGRMKVTQKGQLLHYVNSDNFMDSAEWFAATESGATSLPIFKVTVTADSKCTFISWKRKGLLALLSKRQRLAKILRVMIGRDVARKLYQLNASCINEKGFRFDVRLPCIMSLPDDVERRRKATAVTFLAPGTPGMDDARKHKHKKLGKTAQAKYANMFASKLRARVSMRKSQKATRPVVREALKDRSQAVDN